MCACVRTYEYVCECVYVCAVSITYESYMMYVLKYLTVGWLHISQQRGDNYIFVVAIVLLFNNKLLLQP